MTNPATESVMYEAMKPNFELINALMGGTRAMREAGKRYLPQEDKESDDAYKVRLERSVLYEAFSDTIEKIVALPFSKVVTVTENIEELIDRWNISGEDITCFTKDLFEASVKHGVVHVLIDGERVGPDATAEGDNERRVTCKIITAPQLIAWSRNEEDSELDSIRWRETIIVKDGDYGDKEIDQVTEYTRTQVTIFRKDGETWAEHSQVEHQFGRVPLVTFYTKRTGDMTGEPPLMKLAWLNLVHYQSFSDQRNILRFSRFPIIFGKGIDENTIKKGVTIGPARAILVEGDNADMKYLEHTGAAISAGRQDLLDLVMLMESVGMQPFVKRATATATSQNLDAKKTNSSIKAWLRLAEAALWQIAEISAQWLGEEMPDDAFFEIFDDFEVSLYSNTEATLLLQLAIANKLTTEQLLIELRRRGILSEALDPEEEAEKIESRSGFGDTSLGGIDDTEQ